MARTIPGPTFDTMEDYAHKEPRILVVDDDLAMRRILTYALEHRHYKVDTLPSGVQLRQVLEGNPPDLIILDVMMPWKNGFDLCKAIKDNPRWRSIPVLFVTGKRDDEDFATGLSMGGDGYLTKPFTLKELQQKISELLPTF